MTLMLTAPSSPGSNQPLFTPSEVVQFYKENGPHIFKLRPLWDPIRCPKYDGMFLRNKARELLKETRLNQTLTNVVITSFDERKIYPVIFSSFKLKTQTY
ncbi:patatin-like protein 4 [Vigna umbellata]|uniref:patatin-like protein 4 n=1 Tax=Vigna umbellata TaxID=87088 RepID=UPI001F5F70B8|nr:patatin-like protein 4 [Vigna umbellata]